MWPFTKPARPARTTAATPPKATGFELIAGYDRDAMDAEATTLHESAVKRAFRKTPHEHMRVGKPGGTFAMDDATGLLSRAKGAYSLARDTIPEIALNWFASYSFLGFQVCGLIAQHWLVNRACEVPARDAARNGYTLVSADGEELEAKVAHRIAVADKKYGLRQQCVEFVKMGRVFGIRIALFKVESPDPLYYEQPFNPDGIRPGSYRGIVQVDPYWCSPELSERSAADPTDAMFYQPTWWIINGRRYHHTHLVIMTGPEVTDVLKPSYMYAGLSIPQQMWERAYAAERTANEVPILTMTKRSTILYTDMDKAVANEGKFVEKLLAWARFRDNMAIKVAGTGDKIDQHDTTLTDVDAVVMNQYQICAAIAEMPVTKLMGTSVKGMNATGEYDTETYHESLESVQTNDMEPLVNRHHICLIRSEIAPALGVAPFDVSIVWSPLDVPTSKEQAETNKLKAETDKALMEAGAIDGMDARDRLRGDKESGYTGLAEVSNADPLVTPGPTVSMDASLFDVATGCYAEAELITNQTYIDDAIVAAKLVERDFTVQISPEFITSAGKRVRVIIDGHHSLQAALRSGNMPVFVEGDYTDSDYVNAVVQRG